MRLVKLSDRITVNLDNIAYCLDEKIYIFDGSNVEKIDDIEKIKETIKRLGVALESIDVTRGVGVEKGKPSMKMSLIFVGNIRLDLTDNERIEFLECLEKS